MYEELPYEYLFFVLAMIGIGCIAVLVAGAITHFIINPILRRMGHDYVD